MHQIQKIILKRLSQNNGLRYADLTRNYDYEDNIVFHLKQLQNESYVSKKDNLYFITPTGLKSIYEFELNDLSDPGVKRYFIGLVIVDSQGNYLIKSHPSATQNFYNLPSGWPWFGESMNDAFVRIAKNNIGITIDPKTVQFVSLHSKTVKTSDNEVLFDEGFAIFKITISDSQKSKLKLLESISWMSVNDIKKLENRWPELDLCILNIPKPYESYSFISDYLLLS